ncbi:MAG: LPS export ABC transporter permease LptG [Thermodesulfobacteriota bacterium]
MRTLDRYLLREFIKIFILSLLSFVTLYLSVDVFELIDDIFERHLPFSVAVQFFIYKIPSILNQISPIAALMSTLLAVGMLSRHQELTAVKAGGVSIIRCARPLLLCGLVISILNIFINEAIVPIANRENAAIHREWFEGEQKGDADRESGTIWFREGNAIYSIERLNSEEGRAKGFDMYLMGEAFVPVTQLHADEVTRIDNEWRVTTGTVRNFAGDGGITTEVISDRALSLIGGPAEIGRRAFNPEEMSYVSLRQFIKTLRAEGYEAHRYRVDLHSKAAFPFVNLVMVLIGIPFAVSGERRGGFALSITVTVLIGFSYWIVSATNISLGHSGVVPPFVAAWFTNLIFATVGLLMLSHVKQ